MDTQSNVRPLHKEDVRSVLDEIVREGARHMLQRAIEAEVAAYLMAYADLHDEEGRRLVVRNGHQPVRQVLTGAGPLDILDIRKPRVDDRRAPKRFTSAILPRYLSSLTGER